MSSIENGGKRIESSEGLNNQNELQAVLGTFQDFEGLQDFLKILETRDDEKEILSIFLNVSIKEDINLYLEKYGFPPDEEAIMDFKKEFSRTNDNKRENIYMTEGLIQESAVKTQESAVKRQESVEKLEELKKKVGVFTTEIIALKENSALKSLPKFGELITKLEETAKSGDYKANDGAKEEIIKFLNDGNNLQTILETAKKAGDTQYNNILSSITYFAEGNPELKQKLNKWNEKIEKENFIKNESSVIRQVQTKEFFGSNPKGITSTGKGFQLGDKEIDFSTIPPSAFIKSENGYKLETKLPSIPKEYNEKRREWQKRRDGLKKDFEREKNSFDLKEAELKDYEKDFPEPRESWAETKFQTMKNDLVTIEKNITKIQQDIEAIDLEMKQFFSKIEFEDKVDREKRENEKREVAKFLASIGFDRIPQSITDNLINQLNSNSVMRSKLGFTTQIDLKNCILGTDTNGVFTNITSITSQEKVNFAKAFNIMLFGKEDGLINLNSIQYGSGAPITNITEFLVFLNDFGLKNSGTAVQKMKINIEKYSEEKNKD